MLLFISRRQSLPIDRAFSQKPAPGVFLGFHGLILAIAITLAETGQAALPPSENGAAGKLVSLPMQFEANAGQVKDPVRYLSRGPGYTVLLAPNEASILLRPTKHKHSTEPAQTELRMKLLGANPKANVVGVSQLSGTVNYFLGNDPNEWHSAIPTFARVKSQQIYPGIDVIYYGNEKRLEYDFVVNPGGDPDHIQMRFEGADRLELDKDGSLIVHMAGNSIQWHKPVAYQGTPEVREEIPASFVLTHSRRVGFKLGAYDPTRPLIIDPILVYASYLGGSASDFASGAVVDGSGNLYIVGDTASANFPTLNGYHNAPYGSNDVFVTKINPNGNGLVFSTFLGGNGDDFAGGISLDSSNNVYVTGKTESFNFPTKNPAYAANSGYRDIFITRLAASGAALVYSSYLGGGNDDVGTCVAADNNGNAYVSGYTYSIGTGNGSFPTVPSGAYQRNNNGGADAFVAKFNTAASGPSSLVYSTFLGGSTDERAFGIAIDSAGTAYVVGTVISTPIDYGIPPTSDYPVTAGAFQPQFNQGSTNADAGSFDGFLTRLNAAGTALIYSTFLGGGDDDLAYAVTVDSLGRIYVVGETASLDFPSTADAVQPVIAGDPDFPAQDAFVTIFNTNGSSLRYSTFLGGSLQESGFTIYKFGLAVDGSGQVYVAGQTSSYDFPVTVGADRTNSFAISDGFVSKINPAVPGPNGLIYSTLVSGDSAFNGGGADNRCVAVAVNTNGDFFVAGITTATNFPASVGAYDATFNGPTYDTFVARYGSPRDLSVAMSASLDPVVAGSNLTYRIQINNNSLSTMSTVTNTFQVATNFSIVSVTRTNGSPAAGSNATSVSTFYGTVPPNFSATLFVVVNALASSGTALVTNSAIVTSTDSEPNTGNNVAPVAATIRGVTDVTLLQSVGPTPVYVTSNMTYTIGITNKGPSTATSLTVTDVFPSIVTISSATLLADTNVTQGTFDTNTPGVLVCTLTNLPKSAGAAIQIFGIASAIGTAANFASVTPFEFDTANGNNSSTLNTLIYPAADLRAGQSGPSSGSVGVNMAYNLTVTNLGPSTATNVTLSDLLPSGLTFANAAASQGTVTPSGNTVNWNVGTLANNAVASVTISVTPNTVGTVTNTGTVSSPVFDPVAQNVSPAVVTTISPAADLAIGATVTPASTLVSSNVVFSISITNRGPSSSTGVNVSDTLPPGFSIVSVQPSLGASQTNGVVTWSVGTLANGATASMSVTARANLDGTFTNTASVTATTPDSNPNNTASAVVTIADNPASPLLKIARSGTNVILSWSTNAIGYTLLSKTNLAAIVSWANVTNIPVAVGARYTVTNAMAAGPSFYRLLQAPPALRGRVIGSRFVISWSAISPPAGTLKSTANLASGPWNTVGTTPVLIQTNYFVTNNLSANPTFYRLFR